MAVRQKPPIIPGDTRPLALQLAQVLADEIARGLYPEGRRLPGQRTLAQRWGVADQITQDAIKLLASKGLVRKGIRTQAAEVIGDADLAKEVRGWLASLPGLSEFERIDDFEVRLTTVQTEVEELRVKVEGQESHVLALHSEPGEEGTGRRPRDVALQFVQIREAIAKLDRKVDEEIRERVRLTGILQAKIDVLEADSNEAESPAERKEGDART